MLGGQRLHCRPVHRADVDHVGCRCASDWFPAAQLNEGMTIVVTGLLIGVGIGSAIAGQMVEDQGATRASAVPVIAAALAFVPRSDRARSVAPRRSGCCGRAGGSAGGVTGSPSARLAAARRRLARQEGRRAPASRGRPEQAERGAVPLCRIAPTSGDRLREVEDGRPIPADDRPATLLPRATGGTEALVFADVAIRRNTSPPGAAHHPARRDPGTPASCPAWGEGPAADKRSADPPGQQHP